jgi:hypothetical protein
MGLLADAAEALAPFAAEADIHDSLDADVGPEPSFLDCQRAANALAAIRRQLADRSVTP